MTDFTGTSGNDTITGTNDPDNFDMSQGGRDDVFGLDGEDVFSFGAALTHQDSIDGGGGHDILGISGDYSAGLTFNAGSLVSVEEMTFGAGNDYDITLIDENVSGFFNVTGSALGVNDTLVFRGDAETDTSFTFNGGAGDDFLLGGTLGSSFILSTGGSDTAIGGAGGDVFSMVDAFDTGDAIIGGGGVDFVALFGASYLGFTISGAMMSGMEVVQFNGNFDYDVALTDDVVASGEGLFLNVTTGDVNFGSTIDASGERDGTLHFQGGAGDDTFKGGKLDDVFSLGSGGKDIARGNKGDDTFNPIGTLTASDQIDGGKGTDSAELFGDYSAGIVFKAKTMTGVETLNLADGGIYDFTTHDATVAAGDTLTIIASDLDPVNSVTLDGGAEADGRFVVTSGDGDDVLKGGAGDDDFTAGAGADTLTGGAGTDRIDVGDGSDTVIIGVAGHSTGAGRDTVVNFSGKKDAFDLSAAIVAVDADVTSGALSEASFNTDLAAAIGAGEMGAGHAVLFSPDAGDLAGRVFLIADRNGTAGYQANADYVVELEAATNLNALDAGNFI
jgi:hypothetical protein